VIEDVSGEEDTGPGMIIKGERFSVDMRASRKEEGVDKPDIKSDKSIPNVSSPEPDKSVVKDGWTKGKMMKGSQCIATESEVSQTKQSHTNSTSVQQSHTNSTSVQQSYTNSTSVPELPDVIYIR